MAIQNCISFAFDEKLLGDNENEARRWFPPRRTPSYPNQHWFSVAVPDSNSFGFVMKHFAERETLIRSARA